MFSKILTSIGLHQKKAPSKGRNQNRAIKIILRLIFLMDLKPNIS